MKKQVTIEEIQRQDAKVAVLFVFCMLLGFVVIGALTYVITEIKPFL